MTAEEIAAAETPRIKRRADDQEIEDGEQIEIEEPTVAELIASLQKKGVNIHIPDDFDEQEKIHKMMNLNRHVNLLVQKINWKNSNIKNRFRK